MNLYNLVCLLYYKDNKFNINSLKIFLYFFVILHTITLNKPETGSKDRVSRIFLEGLLLKEAYDYFVNNRPTPHTPRPHHPRQGPIGPSHLKTVPFVCPLNSQL